MAATDDEFLQELRATFAGEAKEHLHVIVTGLLALESAAGRAAAPATLETMFRAAHSLKGAARAVEMRAVESQAQSLEDMFARLRADGGPAAPQALEQLHAMLDRLTAALAGTSTESARAAPARSATHVAVPDGGAPPAADGAEPPTDTVRVSVAKLEACVLHAEEMLAAKAAATQQSGQVAELLAELQASQRRHAAVEGQVRQLRRGSRERPAGGLPMTAPALHRLLDAFDRNAAALGALETRLQLLAANADAHRQALAKQVNEALDCAKSLLLMPFASMAGGWPKLVRDLCHEQGKEADLVIRGGDVELDKRILEEIKDPLIHLLRNSVDHGIESRAQRLARGKPVRGCIAIDVRRAGSSEVQIVVSDDGAGIDPGRVRAAALKNRLVTPEQVESMSEAEVQALVFRSSMSTSPRVTTLSGRGLGLAIVQERAQRLGGEAVLESRAGQGTTFRIRVPTVRAAFRGIVVDCGGHRVVLPTIDTERVTQAAPAALRKVQAGQAIVHQGRTIPLLRLADVLQRAPARSPLPEAGGFPAVIVNGRGRQAAFAVDAVLGEQEVVVKPIGRPLARVRNVAAATVLASGEVAMILDAGELVRSGLDLPCVPAPAQEERVAAKPSILVAEDSITSRMLVRAILEAAGYAVKTAVDGLEALNLLRDGRFDLVVSDVEMPRLDGFELTERIRADRTLSALPVVLVTSLEAREHRERGMDVGANAYVVKSQFDQGNLLEIIERLLVGTGSA